MVLLVGLLSLGTLVLGAGANMAEYRAACASKAVGDYCEYVSNQVSQCDWTTMLGGSKGKFCRYVKSPGAKTNSACTIDDRLGVFACFQSERDNPVFQACAGQRTGSACRYETQKYTAYGHVPHTTDGTCFAHPGHQGHMCLEAVGQEDDEECSGRRAGEECETADGSNNAICSYHPQSGQWECVSPKAEGEVYVACLGMAIGMPCSYMTFVLGEGRINFKGECCPYTLPDGSGHGEVMCLNPDHLGGVCGKQGLPTGAVVAIVIASALVFAAVGAAAVVVLYRKFVVKQREQREALAMKRDAADDKSPAEPVPIDVDTPPPPPSHKSKATIIGNAVDSEPAI